MGGDRKTQLEFVDIILGGYLMKIRKIMYSLIEAATVLSFGNIIAFGAETQANDGVNSQGRPGYTVTATIYSSNLSIKSSRLMTRAENVSSWNTNSENHSSRVAVNSRLYVYTSNVPANPYCDARLWVTDSEAFETYIGATRLTNAK